MKPLLIGESNPYSRDPDDALLPYPDRSAGHRFCTVILGMGRAEYLRAFDRCNLIQGDTWSVPAARLAAERILNERPVGDLVLLGRKVAAAFGVVSGPFSRVGRDSAFLSDENGSYIVLPHPSGRCTVWNAPAAIYKTREMLLPSVERQKRIAEMVVDLPEGSTPEVASAMTRFNLALEKHKRRQ